jgi:hypothetical protein
MIDGDFVVNTSNYVITVMLNHDELLYKVFHFMVFKSIINAIKGYRTIPRGTPWACEQQDILNVPYEQGQTIERKEDKS